MMRSTSRKHKMAGGNQARDSAFQFACKYRRGSIVTRHFFVRFLDHTTRQHGIQYNPALAQATENWPKLRRTGPTHGELALNHVPPLQFCSQILLAVLLTTAPLAVDTPASPSSRPNILLIVTDDQAPQTLRAYGNKTCETPNIDRLAAQGMTLDGAYHMGSWAGAVCTPSRHMIMTGRTVWHIPDRARPKRNRKAKGRNPNQGNSSWVPENLAEQTLPAIFNRAGYDTFRTCKKGNSYEGANQQFTVRRDATKRGHQPADSSQWHADQTIQYLQERAKSNDRDPFLIYLGFSHPHDTRNGTAELLQKYGAENRKQPPITVNPLAPPLQINYLPAHPFPHGHPGLRDEEKVAGVFKSRSEPTIRNELGREYACIEHIDTQVGRVLKQLEEMGELKNTYVIFTADHGIAVGRHGLTGKQNLYEHTWRVPLIVKGPQIEPSTRSQGNVYLLDILPTLCDLTEVTIPQTVEGASFKPVLLGEQQATRDVLYGVYCGGTKPGIRSLRRGNWKLIKYDLLDGQVRRTQLFNLESNPNELLQEHDTPTVSALTGNHPSPDQRNLADDPRFAQVRQELENLLLAEQRRLHDPYRFWDQPNP